MCCGSVQHIACDIFEQLSDIDKTAYVLGSELWEENFEDTLRLVKEFIVDVWEVRKQKLYGEDACPSHHHSQTLAGDKGPVTVGGGLRVSKMGKLQDKGMYRYVVVMCMLYSDCGSAHCNGCVVNGISARTAC